MQEQIMGASFITGREFTMPEADVKPGTATDHGTITAVDGCWVEINRVAWMQSIVPETPTVRLVETTFRDRSTAADRAVAGRHIHCQ